MTVYSMPASVGLFYYTGQDIRLGRLVATQGSYTGTGQTTTTVRVGRYILGANGSTTGTGQAASLKKSYTLSVLTASYPRTGQTAGLLRGLKMVGGQGSTTGTGQVALFAHGHYLIGAKGTFTRTGQTVLVRKGTLRSCATGTYTHTYRDAGVYRRWTILGAYGTHNRTGQAATFKAARLLAATLGQYTPGSVNRFLHYHRLAVLADVTLGVPTPPTTATITDEIVAEPSGGVRAL